MLNEIKSKPCMDCGGIFDPVCMDFDHRPGEVKSFNVAAWRNFSANVTTAKLHAEIAKCDVVCANCHRIRTFKHRDHYELIKKGEEAGKSRAPEPQLALFASNDNDDKEAA